MSNPKPELSSIASALSDLTNRLTTLAESLNGKTGGDDIAHELFEVERHLKAGQRRLDALTR